MRGLGIGGSVADGTCSLSVLCHSLYCHRIIYANLFTGRSGMDSTRSLVARTGRCRIAHRQHRLAPVSPPSSFHQEGPRTLLIRRRQRISATGAFQGSRSTPQTTKEHGGQERRVLWHGRGCRGSKSETPTRCIPSYMCMYYVRGLQHALESLA